MSRSKKQTCGPDDIYCDDFETCDTPVGDAVRVWCWASALDGIIEGFGTDISSYIDFLVRTPGIHYFHNLKFDGSFIVWHILTEGWKWVPDRPAEEHQFTSLIADDGSWYSLHLHMGDHIVEIRDSLKKIPLPVRAIPDAFGLENECKGEIDYERVRPEDYEPTIDEWRYVFTDVRIVSLAMKQLYNQGLDSLTQSSDAFNAFKDDNFRLMFPAITEETDQFIRGAYRGGFTYASPRFSGTVHHKCGIVVDANSMYPSVMYSKRLPYGPPCHVDVMPENPNVLWIGKLWLDIRVKSDHIPCVSELRHVLFGAADYVDAFNGEVTITSVDWDLINQQYDILDWSFIEGYTFNSTDDMFRRYIDKWYAVKQHSTGGKRWVAKGMLNKLYGKFGMRTHVASKRPEMSKDNIVKYVCMPEETRDAQYTPLACFVTSWARYVMIRAAQANYATFAYCDTDSMHLLGQSVRGVDVDDSRLGAWKVEGRFKKALYRRAKCYMETIDNKDVVHVAGLPAKLAAEVTYEDMLTGAELRGKLVPKHVVGGVRLVETTFTIK